jgi:hypothetical protein
VIEAEPDWNPKHGSWFARPRIEHITGALEDAYALRGDEGLRSAALAKAAGYDADAVFDAHWRPYLAGITGDVERLAAAKDRRAKRAARNLRSVA